jgi:pimeloyl-ACP methyl ester carboxylesterase
MSPQQNKETREGQAQTVNSKDGTPIAYWRSGQGPPFVLVHGTSADHSRWKPILPAFKEHFSVYAVDRRGRGDSGDAEDYSIEREFEDIAAVVDSIGEPTILLGHSYGALCTLEAALLTRNVRKLVLYEPGINVTGEQIYPPGFIDRLHALLEAGDRDAVISTMFRDLVGMSQEEVEYLRSLPAWQERVKAAHTVPRELRADEHYHFVFERFRGLSTPTLALEGSDSPAFLKAADKAVDEALPNCRIVVIPGKACSDGHWYRPLHNRGSPVRGRSLDGGPPCGYVMLLDAETLGIRGLWAQGRGS